MPPFLIIITVHKNHRSKPAVGSTELSVQGEGFLSWGKAAGAWLSPPTPETAQTLDKDYCHTYKPSTVFVACSKKKIYFTL